MDEITENHKIQIDYTENDHNNVRSHLLNFTSNKIKEHVNYMIATLGTMITAQVYFPKLKILYLASFPILIFFFLGRIFYWTQVSSYCLTHWPIDVTTLPVYDNKIHQSNSLWGIYTASVEHINMNKKINAYQIDKPDKNQLIAKIFSQSKKILILIVIYFVGLILGWILNNIFT